MNDCLFCKITKNEIESFTLFEDDKLKVILDAFPEKPGHTLIIPKVHYKDLDDIPLDLLTDIFDTAKRIKLLLEAKLNPVSITLIQNNGEAEKIKHFHLHLIPSYNEKNTLSKEEIFKILMEK